MTIRFAPLLAALAATTVLAQPSGNRELKIQGNPAAGSAKASWS